MAKRIRVIDSHTAGEPTRVVVDGGPNLGTGPLTEQVKRFHTLHDSFRKTVILEPRGSDILVGALMVPPHDPSCSLGVIFFNNVGPIGMCGHGTIGLMASLNYLKPLTPGPIAIDTTVGPITATYHADGRVTVKNVASYLYREGVKLTVPGHGEVSGDIAWGGNWFFLVKMPREQLVVQKVEEYTAFTKAIRKSLEENEITGKDGGVIDHIELNGPALLPGNHGRNFVLCPGAAYDRSPCGTGTSAKLACLAAKGDLAPNSIWKQESILGTVFEGVYENLSDGLISPCITGQAFITGDNTLIVEDNDPLKP